MSNPLNGGVRPHASNPLPFSPNPAGHFEDSRSTCLGELVAAADYQQFCANSLSKEIHLQLPFGVFSAKDGLPVVLSLLSGISEICAAAVAANTDAHWVIENGGLNDEE